VFCLCDLWLINSRKRSVAAQPSKRQKIGKTEPRSLPYNLQVTSTDSQDEVYEWYTLFQESQAALEAVSQRHAQPYADELAFRARTGRYQGWVCIIWLELNRRLDY
jgi:hypothetical protein